MKKKCVWISIFSHHKWSLCFNHTFPGSFWTSPIHLLFCEGADAAEIGVQGKKQLSPPASIYYCILPEASVDWNSPKKLLYSNRYFVFAQWFPFFSLCLKSILQNHLHLPVLKWANKTDIIRFYKLCSLFSADTSQQSCCQNSPQSIVVWQVFEACYFFVLFLPNIIGLILLNSTPGSLTSVHTSFIIVDIFV